MKCNITCFPEKPHHLSWIRVACQQKGSFRTLATGRFSGVCQYLRSAILSSFVSSVIQQEGWTSKDRGRTSAGRGRRWLWSWGGSTSKSRCFIEAIEFLPFTLGVLMSHWFFYFSSLPDSGALSWQSSSWVTQQEEVSEHLCQGGLYQDSISQRFTFDEKDILLKQNNLQPMRWAPDQTDDSIPPTVCPGYYQVTILGNVPAVQPLCASVN